MEFGLFTFANLARDPRMGLRGIGLFDHRSRAGRAEGDRGKSA
jgi:hypothetical protein